LKLLSECGFPAARLEIEVAEDAWALDFTMWARKNSRAEYRLLAGGP
jgi:hypothetical protein